MRKITVKIMKTNELMEKAINWFNEIAAMCAKLTSGNVSHIGPNIRSSATAASEYLEKQKSMLWHDATEKPEKKEEAILVVPKRYVCDLNVYTCGYDDTAEEPFRVYNERFNLRTDEVHKWAYEKDILPAEDFD